MRIVAGLVGLAGLFLACGTATAQTTIDRYDPAVLTKIVEDMGYDVLDEADASEDDGPFLIFENGDGLIFGFQGAVCDDKKAGARCLGILIYGALTPPEDDDFDSLSYMNTYNIQHSAAKLVDENGDLALTRYLIMDDGISRENLRVNVDVFVELYEALQKDLTK